MSQVLFDPLLARTCRPNFIWFRITNSAAEIFFRFFHPIHRLGSSRIKLAPLRKVSLWYSPLGGFRATMPCPVSPEQRATLALLEAYRVRLLLDVFSLGSYSPSQPVSTCVNCVRNGLECIWYSHGRACNNCEQRLLPDCGGLKLEYFRFRFTQGVPRAS